MVLREDSTGTLPSAPDARTPSWRVLDMNEDDFFFEKKGGREGGTKVWESRFVCELETQTRPKTN